MNTLYIGDNLRSLATHITPASVDCVYLDPPFNSGRNYSTDRQIGAVASGTVAFTDTFRWDGETAERYAAIVRESPPALAAAMDILHTVYPKSGLLAYMTFMAPRLVALHRTLRRTGCLWLHCDDSANFALALVLDGIFGLRPANRVIAWKRTSSHGGTKRALPRVHDTLLFRPRTIFHRLNKMETPLDDVWLDIGPLNASSKERTGYPTQKPLALLERIIGSSCKPGGVVLDPFVGSGTTIVAAHRLGRRWIGMDLSPLAGEVVRSRLGNAEFRVVETASCGEAVAA